MFGGCISQRGVFAVNWIIRRAGVGVGVALVTMIVLVAAIAAGFFAARHGTPLGGGLIWVKR
jgi:hypothetical protein